MNSNKVPFLLLHDPHITSHFLFKLTVCELLLQADIIHLFILPAIGFLDICASGTYFYAWVH